MKTILRRYWLIISVALALALLALLLVLQHVGVIDWQIGTIFTIVLIAFLLVVCLKGKRDIDRLDRK